VGEGAGSDGLDVRGVGCTGIVLEIGRLEGCVAGWMGFCLLGHRDRLRRGRGRDRQEQGVLLVRVAVRRQLDRILKGRRTALLRRCGERLFDSSLPVLVTRHIPRVDLVELLRRSPAL
jgi:hypothetical protein